MFDALDPIVRFGYCAEIRIPGLQGQHQVLLLDVRETGQREQGPQCEGMDMEQDLK